MKKTFFNADLKKTFFTFITTKVNSLLLEYLDEKR